MFYTPEVARFSAPKNKFTESSRLYFCPITPARKPGNFFENLSPCRAAPAPPIQWSTWQSGGASGSAAEEEKDEEPPWWLEENLPSQTWDKIRKSEAYTISSATHLVVPLPNSDGSILVVVRRDVNSTTRRLESDERFLFYFDKQCPLLSISRPDHAWDRIATAMKTFQETDVSEEYLAAKSSFVMSGRLPCFDSNGERIIDRETGEVKLTPPTGGRTCLTYAGVRFGLEHMDIFQGPPGQLRDAKKALRVHEMGASLARLVLNHTPGQIIEMLGMSEEDCELGAADAAALEAEAAGEPGEEILPDRAASERVAPMSISEDIMQRQAPESAPPEAPARPRRDAAKWIQARLALERFSELTATQAEEALENLLYTGKKSVKVQINRLLAQQHKDEVDDIRKQLRLASLDEDEAKKLKRGVAFVSTEDIMEIVQKTFDQRSRRSFDGKNVVLEHMTLGELGAFGTLKGEKEPEAGKPRNYAQERKNLFRHKMDVRLGFESQKSASGLDRLVGLVSFSFGAPWKVLDIHRKYARSVPSQYVAKSIQRNLSERSHILNVLFLLNSVTAVASAASSASSAATSAAGKAILFSYDNFIRNMKLSMNIGGKIGSYFSSHVCHMAGKVVTAPSVLGLGWVFDSNTKTSCWRCRDEPRPSGEDSVPDCQGAGLCRLCIMRPPTVVDKGCLDKITKSVKRWCRMRTPRPTRAQLSRMTADAARPMQHCLMIVFLSAIILRSNASTNFQDCTTLFNLGLTAQASPTTFTSTPALFSIYAQHAQAWDEDKSYPLHHVERPMFTQGSRVIDVSCYNTNTVFGLLGHHILITSHMLLGPFLQKNMVALLADSRCYGLIERLWYNTKVLKALLCKVISRGLRGCHLLDCGLHVVNKFTEHIFLAFAPIIEIYFNGLVARGEGKFFKKTKLSLRLTVISVMFQAHLECRQELLDLRTEFPNDHVVESLVFLHEFLVPLVIYYHYCFKLGRDPKMETRRDMFDLWLSTLLPLTIVALHHIGSSEYGKVLMQFAGKILWWQDHDKAMFSFVRDNFANVLDGEFIELIHSWVVNNHSRVNFKATDYSQTRDAFLRKDKLQEVKDRLMQTLGINTTDPARSTQVRASFGTAGY